jgi:hydroxymethylglutaryl-CoA lyase
MIAPLPLSIRKCLSRVSFGVKVLDNWSIGDDSSHMDRRRLQNERHILPTHEKIELVRRAVASGIRRLEVASFVNPERVPQMADGEAVLSGLERRSDVTYIGLALNFRGAQRAISSGVDEVGLVCPASDTFGRRNQGQTVESGIDMAVNAFALVHGAGVKAQATIAVAFGCPFEGRVDPSRVVAMARQLAGAGACEIAIADTIGIATPFEVADLVKSVRSAIAPTPVRVHFHNTRGMGVANAYAAVQAGAVVVDASIGGTGGCPFAPGAAGNVATEEIAFAFNDHLGLDIPAILEAAKWLDRLLDRRQPTALMRSAAGTDAGAEFITR